MKPKIKIEDAVDDVFYSRHDFIDIDRKKSVYAEPFATVFTHYHAKGSPASGLYQDNYNQSTRLAEGRFIKAIHKSYLDEDIAHTMAAILYRNESMLSESMQNELEIKEEAEQARRFARSLLAEAKQIAIESKTKNIIPQLTGDDSSRVFSFNVLSGVYILIRDNCVVYVGETKNVFERLSGHREKLYDSVRFIPIDGSKEARVEVESRLIQLFNPEYNIAGSGLAVFNNADGFPSWHEGGENSEDIERLLYEIDGLDPFHGLEKGFSQ